MRTPIDEALLYELREMRATVEALATLLKPESSEEDADPAATLAATLTELTRLIGEQSVQLQELRADVAEMSAVLQDSD